MGWTKSDGRSRKRVGLLEYGGTCEAIYSSSALLRIGLGRGAERRAVRSRPYGTPFTQVAGGVFEDLRGKACRAKTMTATQPAKPRRGAKNEVQLRFLLPFFLHGCKNRR